MAKAVATCTCATCGKTFEKIAFKQNRREADSWTEWAETHIDECPDCYKARREREKETARKEAKAEAETMAEELNLPELTGSEKQVTWAITIRHGVIGGMFKEFKPPKNPDKHPDFAERASIVRRFVLLAAAEKTEAHWWIDHRERYAGLQGLKRLRMDLPELWEAAQTGGKDPAEVAAQAAAEKEAQAAAETEMIAAPEKQTHSGVVKITVTEMEVTAQYVRDDDFRAIVKAMGYLWDAGRWCWRKPISLRTGTAQERAAELGSKLLNKGFAIQIADPETRQKAVSADYQPERVRWVATWVTGDCKGNFAVMLPNKGDSDRDRLYAEIKKLPGARYHQGDFSVPPQSFRELLDFAQQYDYKFLPAAEELLEKARAAVITVTPAPAKDRQYTERDPKELLKSGAEVLPDLRDDD